MTDPTPSAYRRGESSARVRVPLAGHLLSRLNSYGLAASAAGVALLACSNSAEAAPVCGSLSVTLRNTDTYAFNPAFQKQAPFNVAHTYNELSSHTQSLQARGFFIANTPGAKVMASANGLPTELASGASIGPGGNFGKGKQYGLLFGYYYRSRFKGNFQPNQGGYVGFQFTQSGQPHYGWLRVKLAKQNGARFSAPALLLSEFGYESSPNTSITAGTCGSSAELEERAPSANRNTNVEANQQTVPNARAVSAPLGALALGFEGIALWRTKKVQ